jgi:signal peptidase I
MLACLATLMGALWWVASGQKAADADIVGFRPYLVATGSMAPTDEVHGFVLTHETPFEQVEEGDVVAFRAAALGDAPAMHRVIDITRDKAGTPLALTVKGDNNPHPDGAPVTRENYLGRAIFHTNVTAFVWDQAHAPYGMLRVVVLPVAMLLLTWTAGHFLLAGRRTLLGRTTVVATMAFCLLASAAGSYALYLDKKQDYITTTLDSYATAYERQTPDRTMSVQDTPVQGTIDIPRIDVHYPVIEYVAASSLNVAITHYDGPGLNEEGNVVLAGHHAWDNLYFTRIDRLEAGDTIWVTDADRHRVRYLVTGHHTVAPDDTSVLAQPDDGKRHLTLISCTYDLRNRYIVEAVAADRPSAHRGVVDEAGVGIWPDEAVPVAVALGGIAVLGAGWWLVAAAERRRRGAVRVR